MTSQAARNLRAHIDALAIELAAAKTVAEVRAIKIAIRAAEIALTVG